jgi:hypothetical protein
VGEPAVRWFQVREITDDWGKTFVQCEAIASPDKAQGELPHVVVKALEFSILYPIVRLGNWRVIGMMEALEAGTLLFGFSRDEGNEQLLEAWRGKPIGCDHCHAKRKRALGFILQDEETGELCQVGSTCLKDYTGIDPAAALFLAKLHGSFSAMDEDFGERMQHSAPGVSTLQYLEQVAYCIHRAGFISASKARDEGVSATYEDAVGIMSELEQSSTLREAYLAVRDACREKAAAVHAWILAQSEASLDTYGRNVQIVLAQEALSLRERRQLALAASAFSFYERAHREKGPAKAPSEHFGQAGDKVTNRLRLLRRSAVETPYGMSFFFTFEDEEQRIVSWKTSSPPNELSWADSIGKLFEASFRIKGHSFWRDTPQTDVTHLKFLGWALESAAALPLAPLDKAADACA